MGFAMQSVEGLVYKDWLRMVTYNPRFNLEFFLSSFNLKCDDTIIDWKIDREYGKQKSEYGEDGYLYYVKFPNFMCLDYDEKTLEQMEEIIERILERYPEILLHLYKTYNGYHIYIVSHIVEHFSIETARFMIDCDCDPWYVGFSYKNGFRVRVSKKKGRGEEKVQEFVKEYGCGVVDANCIERLNWMLELCDAK